MIQLHKVHQTKFGKIVLYGFPIIFITVVLISSFAKDQSKKTVVSGPKNYVDLVYPQLHTHNPRCLLFSSNCRPFGMVNLSPIPYLVTPGTESVSRGAARFPQVGLRLKRNGWDGNVV